MTNHPGDYNSFLRLAQLREEQLERNQRRHHLAQQAPYRPGLRGNVASFLRSIADRVEARPAQPDVTQARRYQRAP
jgi:hypothetical protein